MPVYPAPELSRLGPWVGIEHPMGLQFDFGFGETRPEGFGLGAEQEVVSLVCGLVFGQTMRGLIDANYPAVGIAAREQGRTHAGPAIGVQHQRARLSGESFLQHAKCLPGVCRAGLTPGVFAVIANDRQKVSVDATLIRDDAAIRGCLPGRLRSHSHLAIIP